MSTSIAAVKAPWHLWVVGALSLLWNSGGAISYTTTHLGMLESLEMPADQIAFYASFPAWAVAFWALGVWGCFFGSLALLLRSRFAVWLFAISIVGLVGTTIFQWGIAEMPEALSTAGHKLFAAAIWFITLGLFFLRAADAGVGRPEVGAVRQAVRCPTALPLLRLAERVGPR